MAKYNNKRVSIPGHTFDSRKEYNRYCELFLLERGGCISDLKLQVKYILIPTQRDEKGRIVERECSYIADFVYIDNSTHQTIVEDTKGFRTKDYIIKRKLMLERYGIRIKEI